MNRDKLRKYADRIEALPDSFNSEVYDEKPFSMSQYARYMFIDPVTLNDSNEFCGTPCCIAGWVSFWSMGRKFNESVLSIHQLAQHELGLNSSEAYALFTPDNISPYTASQKQAAAAMRRLADTDTTGLNQSKIEEIIWAIE